MFWMWPPESVKIVSIPSPLSIRATMSPPSICAIELLSLPATPATQQPTTLRPSRDIRAHLRKTVCPLSAFNLDPQRTITLEGIRFGRNVARPSVHRAAGDSYRRDRDFRGAHEGHDKR